MGYGMAQDLSQATISIQQQMAIHLTSNHYPPVPMSMVQPCIDAIYAYGRRVNTIAVTNPETNEVITYTEAEVLRFIQDCKVANERNQQSIRDAVYIRNTVYEFFNSQYSPGDQDITTSVEEINEMLRSINADELKRTWSASVRIYVNVSGIEATNKEEVVDMIQDDINVELQSIDGEIWVDDIEVNDVSPE